MKLLLVHCVGLSILSACRASSDTALSSRPTQRKEVSSSSNPLRVGDKWTPLDDRIAYPAVMKAAYTARTERNKSSLLKKSLKYKKNSKSSPKKWKYDSKNDGGDSRQLHRIRRDISDNQVDGDFARVLDRVITLTAPKARSRLQTLWKRLRSVLFNTKGEGANGERADELTKALFQQLFKQFDLPSVLRKRAVKLRRRIGPSGPLPASNSTADGLKKDETVKVVDFRKKNEESKSGDNQIQQWLGMVTDGDKSLAQKEKVDVDNQTTSTTTEVPAKTSTRYPQLSLFQRRKGPVQVAVKVPQKHAKSGIKRFSPAQGRSLPRIAV